MAWTDERVEILSKLWAEGLSASQIAAKLGGVTRNAVIGKVHRLGLSGRAKPKRKTAKPATPRATTTARKRTPAKRRPAPKPAPAPVAVPLEAKPLPNGEYATILTITEHLCKWPLGDPTSADFRFCGRSTNKGEPYCKAHAQLAYQPSRRKVAQTRGLSHTQRRAIR
ncbi:MAG TPA: GcrA cell cycle regulator [Hellea balneolensis]|uniref:GcrA cell cycle regulator n=1 Tax=Hellea balneolensis TaxID=287478 RepID=A0A7V5NXC9_9PROT|nr:GcrA cell cycle regulator [Hellea balneolensis]